MTMLTRLLLALWLSLFPSPLLAQGNTTIESFQTSKHMLSEVYKDHRTTFYRGAEYSEHGEIRLPEGFSTPKYENRATRVEWEHAVPAEAFGRNFPEWKHGGRKHTERVNQEYRLIQADMYNLYPSIGAVNAMRSNYEYTEFLGNSQNFGTCEMKVAKGKAEPPNRTRGQIARTYLYMQDSYPQFHMSAEQQKLMEKWNSEFPVDEWECIRAKRIEAFQGNENLFVKEPCKEKGVW